jgi:hypothetical protein
MQDDGGGGASSGGWESRQRRSDGWRKRMGNPFYDEKGEVKR